MKRPTPTRNAVAGTPSAASPLETKMRLHGHTSFSGDSVCVVDLCCLIASIVFSFFAASIDVGFVGLLLQHRRSASLARAVCFSITVDFSLLRQVPIISGFNLVFRFWADKEDWDSDNCISMSRAAGKEKDAGNMLICDTDAIKLRDIGVSACLFGCSKKWQIDHTNLQGVQSIAAIISGYFRMHNGIKGSLSVLKLERSKKFTMEGKKVSL
ncbi:hypothetical protein LXL04_015936 [Taraxacum kok-saghyz]